MKASWAIKKVNGRVEHHASFPERLLGVVIQHTQVSKISGRKLKEWIPFIYRRTDYGHEEMAKQVMGNGTSFTVLESAQEWVEMYAQRILREIAADKERHLQGK